MSLQYKLLLKWMWKSWSQQLDKSKVCIVTVTNTKNTCHNEWTDQNTHTHTHTHISQGSGFEEESCEKRKVFKKDLKEVMEEAWRTEAGSWFQVVEAWYEKEPWPLDFVRKDGIFRGQKCLYFWWNQRIKDKRQKVHTSVETYAQRTTNCKPMLLVKPYHAGLRTEKVCTYGETLPCRFKDREGLYLRWNLTMQV